MSAPHTLYEYKQQLDQDILRAEQRCIAPTPSSPHTMPEFHTTLAQHTSPRLSSEGVLLHNQSLEYDQVPYRQNWLLEVPPYACPTPESSATSGSELFSPSPEHMENHPVYYMMDQTLPLEPNNMVPHHPCSLTPEGVWQSQFILPQPYMPSWDHGHEPLISQAFSAQCTASSFPLESTMHDVSVASTFGSDSDSGSDCSDSEDEGSSSDQSRRQQHRNSHKDPAAVLKLGKWSIGSDSFQYTTEQRPFYCQYSKYPDSTGRSCSKRFVRPEHLRRHQKTVHGIERNHICKVPDCNRHFSRGDNLRDHYWTHVHRGGRAGKNAKMTLAELKAILGPKEKKLTRRLKQRLAKTNGDKYKVRAKL